MAVRRHTLRVIAESIPDTGREPVGLIDTDDEASPLVLTGFTGWTRRSVQIAAAAVDTPITFTQAVALQLFSDVPVDIRLASGESLVENIRYIGWMGDDEDDGGHGTSILVSVPGASAANLELLYIEQA